MTTLEELRAARALGPLDIRFAEMLAHLASERLEERPKPEVLLAAALASHQMSQGHVCVELARPPVLTDGEGQPLESLTWPDPKRWIASLEASALVEAAGKAKSSDDAPEAPLVIDGAGRVYLQRFWCHQKGVARALLERTRMTFEPHDAKRLRAELARLFPGSDEIRWQRAAALTAIRRGLTVVTGGPGTGKTATVVRMLALLIGEAKASGARPPRVLLVAPTGKAAARLTESIEAALPKLDCDAAIVAEIPRAAATIHRALGTLGGTVTRFRHDADNPLVADVVVVDEASMVDLALMNRLVAAIPPRARLVLLGDRDQLASVEAGAVLGDLCDAAMLDRGYSKSHMQDLNELGGILVLSAEAKDPKPGLRDSIVRLTHSYRYDETSGIGRLSAAIREQKAGEALRILDSDEWPDVIRVDPPPPAEARVLHETSARRILAGFRTALESVEPAEALRAMDGFRVLAAHRRGPFGVEALNARIVEMLRDAGLIGAGDGQFAGRAVLVTRNAYTLSLFNGDVGLVIRDPDEPERLSAVFPASGGTVRRMSPARLPTHETAFAMTVHKSQGSEVDELVLVLPEDSPVVTRELLYTAVTRARKRVVVQASRAAIEQGIETETKRASGLRDLLWGR